MQDTDTDAAPQGGVTLAGEPGKVRASVAEVAQALRVPGPDPTLEAVTAACAQAMADSFENPSARRQYDYALDALRTVQDMRDAHDRTDSEFAMRLYAELSPIYLCTALLHIRGAHGFERDALRIVGAAEQRPASAEDRASGAGPR